MIDSWESSGKNSHRKHKFKEVFQKVTTTRVKNAQVVDVSHVVATSLEQAVSNL